MNLVCRDAASVDRARADEDFVPKGAHADGAGK